MTTDNKTAWVKQDRPPTLWKRFTFAGYAQNRDFLERVAALSKQTGIEPDISFGRDYAILSIHPMTGDELTEAERDFARRVDGVRGGSEGVDGTQAQ